MLLHFNIRFSTIYGQSLLISGNVPELGNGNIDNAVPLTYVNSQFWELKCDINVENINELQYQYILKNGDTQIVEFGEDKVLHLVKYKKANIVTLDSWQDTADYRNNFYTKPFQQVFFAKNKKVQKNEKTHTKANYEVKVKNPFLQPNEQVCVIGNISALNNWQTQAPILLKSNRVWHTISFKADTNDTLIEYKYGIYNTKQKVFVRFEDGQNRKIEIPVNDNAIVVIHDNYQYINNNSWKGAGIAIPVFSLRSKNSFGVGEFADLKLLVNWAKQAGLKLIQLLPINDTIANHNWKDSYPYAAISAFALHPLYLNLQEVAGTKYQAIIKPLIKKQKQLNNLPEVDYEQVIKFKLSVAKELYLLQKDELKDDIEYFNFFELNRHWLVPYAAFCYLRDKNDTSNFNTWKSNSKYNPSNIQRLVSPSQKQYDDIAVHYFIQYHLHLQLKVATAYAHKNQIVLKGDIPIGIYRYSVDAWIASELYNMDEQAGAPPDDFAVKGQNWGFPTYNWEKMQQNNFAWWRQRFEQMGNYFDAFRIDHILGFFRIWSIPIDAVEGILGKFSPVLPIYKNEFEAKGIYFDYDRFCKPYINEQILFDEFGNEANYVKSTFLDGFHFKNDFNTQHKIEKYFEENNIDGSSIKKGLFNLIANVILFEVEGSNKEFFNFRISIANTSSYKHLDKTIQSKLDSLYIDYFYYKQDEFWKKEALQKLPALKRTTNMLICGEDLGMVPHCVPQVMNNLSMLSLEIQRMPKKSTTEFFNPADAPYLSVVTPSTHDMSTIRSWWMEDKSKTQRFFNTLLQEHGEAPFYCESWVVNKIIQQHLASPAMWSIFQLQDILSISDTLRRENPDDDRINIPANPEHYWRYRMHIFLEDLLKQKEFTSNFRNMLTEAGR
ncbi:MAG: 4-alpha-glucanotransferase [Ferruginibacter sp.]|nr:4-alpha-glucanotransferase [Ferruginibacter sp.]